MLVHRFLLLAATLVPPAGLALATRYEAGGAVRVESVIDLGFETSSFRLEIDGEPVERGGGRGGFASEEHRHVVQVDRVLEAEAGRPKLVRRSFETVAAESELDLGGESQERERTGPLEGVTLELSLEGGEVRAEVVGGDEPDEEDALQGHRLDLALDAFLPADGVGEGDTWPLDAEAVKRALAWDLQLLPRSADDFDGPGDRGAGRRGPGRGPRGGDSSRLLGEADWTGQAKLVAAAEESEHGEVARVKIELSAEGDLPEPRFGGLGRGRGRAPREALAARFGARLGNRIGARIENTYELELEGELLFSLEEHRPVHLELEGTFRIETSRELERDGSTYSTSSTREGAYRHVVDVTSVDAGDAGETAETDR